MKNKIHFELRGNHTTIVELPRINTFSRELDKKGLSHSIATGFIRSGVRSSSSGRKMEIEEIKEGRGVWKLKIMSGSVVQICTLFIKAPLPKKDIENLLKEEARKAGFIC
jgi:hypothetical protein